MKRKKQLTLFDTLPPKAACSASNRSDKEQAVDLCGTRSDDKRLVDADWAADSKDASARRNSTTPESPAGPSFNTLDIADVVGKTVRTMDPTIRNFVRNRVRRREIALPSKECKDSKRASGVHTRHCKHDWFEHFQFTTLSERERGIFCLPCVFFSSETAHGGARNASILISKSLTNWKDAVPDQNNHEKLQYGLSALSGPPHHRVWEPLLEAVVCCCSRTRAASWKLKQLEWWEGGWNPQQVCCRPPRAQHLPRRVEKVAKEVGNPGTGQCQSSIQHQWCFRGSKHSLLPQHPEGSHHPAWSTCHHCHSRTQQLSSWLHQHQASKHHGSAATQRHDSPLWSQGHTSGCGRSYWPIRPYEAEAYGLDKCPYNHWCSVDSHHECISWYWTIPCSLPHITTETVLMVQSQTLILSITWGWLAMKSIIFENNIMLRYIVAKYKIKHGRQVANTAKLVAVVERGVY